MKIQDVMTPGVECTSPTATLQEAARRMEALNVGSLPVCENDRLIGMLTDRDIAVRSVARGSDPTTTSVRDTMTPDVISCFDDVDISEAAQLMKENQVRRLPVLDRSKRLVGIVSLGDLAVETGGNQLTAETLERISEPVHQAAK